MKKQDKWPVHANEKSNIFSLILFIFWVKYKFGIGTWVYITNCPRKLLFVKKSKKEVNVILTSLGIVTCVVMMGPPRSP